ncbi:MAG: hypothetical protein JXA66_07055 [Oligoflexia bacterium]|nr:hypothetical protein [Oligoflexia bacterium]
MFDILNSLRIIDEKIRELKRKKKNTPENLVSLKKSLMEKERKFNEKKNNVEDHKSKEDKIKDSITDQKDKLKKAETKLTEVKNAKQYQAGLKEVSQLKKSVSDMEKQELGLMTQGEELTKAFSDTENEYREFCKTYEAGLIKVKDSYNLIERDLVDLADERESILNLLTDDVKQKYLKVHKNNSGHAISLLSNGRCGACNMMLPPQLCNQVLKADSVHICPSCQRIVIHIS